MNKLLISISILLSFISCTDEVNETKENDSKVVIIGYIYANRGIDSIKVGYPYYADDNINSNQPIDDLMIHVTNGTDSTILKSIGNG